MITLIPGDIVSNGIRIHYYRTQHADGRPRRTIVLLHGITGSGLSWPRVVTALAPEYHLICVDARGHGLSEKPPSGYTQDVLAEDVAGLVRGLRLEQPILIGHSMGAATAASVAAQYPDLVRALVLEDPPWSTGPKAEAPTLSPAMVGMLRDQLRRDQSMTPAELIAASQRGREQWAPEDWPDWAIARQQVSLDVLEYRPVEGQALADLARRVTCPTLLITTDTERGGWTPPEVAQEMVTLIPHARWVHIANAGHVVRRDQFDAYIAAVNAFLDELAV